MQRIEFIQGESVNTKLLLCTGALINKFLSVLGAKRSK